MPDKHILIKTLLFRPKQFKVMDIANYSGFGGNMNQYILFYFFLEFIDLPGLGGVRPLVLTGFEVEFLAM